MYTESEMKRIKRSIEEKVVKALEEYEEENGCRGMFQKPIIGYHSAKDPIFDTLFRMGICDHPAKIYRPGYTLITYFLPYNDEITRSNKGGKEPSPQWRKAYIEGTKVLMRLNRGIREALNEEGRLISNLNTPLDWDFNEARESWSYKAAAMISGIGKFSTAGSFMTEKGFGGRLSGVITDGMLVDKIPERGTQEEIDSIVEEIEINSLYKGKPSDECIKACYWGAITEEGIDRYKCQEHCKTINEYVPSPEVCGKCFFYK